MKLDIIASIALAAAILFGFSAAATPAPEQAPAAPRTTPAIHPEFGEVIKTDVQLNSIEKVAFVLHRAANVMLKKMIGHQVVISILGILIMKYGRSAWVHFSKTDISTR
ncbi:MAG: hypothetical protein K2Y02_03560, partial [Burkholderiaceae bacterium]|nr:hypothetical protein [Burkholderiaceae bacterium]